MQEFGKVAVLMGGFSSEREVSLDSGRAVLQSLLRQGVDAHAFDPKIKPLSDLVTEGYQRVFNILHGAFGEDGVVQGALTALNIPYTGCGVTSSAIGMNKYYSRLIWASCGLPTVPFAVLDDTTDFSEVEQRFGFPLFIKPALEGSSVGVYKIKKAGELIRTYHQLKLTYDLILVEKNIGNGEYTCAVLGERALPSIKIIPKTEFYNYEAKYYRNDTEYLCPADLTEKDEKEIQLLALRAFKTIGGRGWGRVDFLRDEQGKFYILEINTVPGMTNHSLVPKAAQAVGLSFDDVCIEVLSHVSLG